MTTTTVPVAAGPAPRTGAGTQFPRLMAMEWTKLRTVRSTMWTLLATLLVSIGLPALIALAVVNDPHGPGPDFDAAGFSLFGLFLGQLIVGALGVLVISAEYSTGSIRTTLTAAPQRLAMLSAKTLTFGIVIAVVSFVTTFAAFFAVQPILNTKNLGTTLTEGPALRMVIGGALYIIAVGLLGLGLGTILRSTAAAVSTVVGLLFVLPIVSGFLPESWRESWVKYLPGNAGGGIFSSRPDPTALGPWQSLAVFAGYALLALVIGAVLLRRRDA
jgi:ABC-type transport system involved in multi-copper enzyme maturation permease subunit